jgi:hypothetical protein
MKQDIGDLLNEWPFDPDEFTARRIKAEDGSERLQIRIDMGLLQLLPNGRPDGQRPHGYASLLDYYLASRDQHRDEGASEEQFALDEDECESLFQEAWQYYHRYLALFYLEDYGGVEVDTEHTLRIFALVQDYASSDEVKWYFEQYYPHAIMMQTRARALTALQADDYQAALSEVEQGIGRIERYVADWEDDEEYDEDLPELTFLRQWQEELEEERPLSQREQLERDLRVAVEAENFEEAARLRDKLRTLRPTPRRHPKTEH